MRVLSVLIVSLLMLAPLAMAEDQDPEAGNSSGKRGGDGSDPDPESSDDDGNETQHDERDLNRTDEESDEEADDDDERNSARDIAKECAQSDEARKCAADYCKEQDSKVCQRFADDRRGSSSVKDALAQCETTDRVDACRGLQDLDRIHTEAKHLSFDVDREGKALVNYSVDDKLLLETIQYGEDTEAFKVDLKGSQLRFETDDSRLVVHDNPTGTFFFKSDDQELFLQFPESAQITATDSGARIDYGTYRAMLVGKDFEAFDHSIILYGGATFHSPVGKSSPEVDSALENGTMGGQLSVGGDDDQVTTFDDVEITVQGDGPATADNPLRIVFDANLTEGRTFVIDVDEDVLLGSELDLRYFDVHDDGNETEVVFRMADSLADVLDPNDDGGQPEYWIVEDENGVQVMVSVPRWSVHAIELASIGEFLIQPSVVIGVAAGVAGVGVASLAMFRPRRVEDDF